MGQKKPRPYREEEVTRLLAELEDRHRDIATIYLETGLCRGELIKLLWSDVDLESRTLIVREPKNEDDRVIPMSSRVYEILAKQRGELERERRKSLILQPGVYGNLADIRQVIDRALARMIRT